MDPNFFNGPALLELLLRYIGNTLVVFGISRLVYYPLQRNREYLFAFFTLNTVVFFVCRLMSNAELGVGFAFGLFAIFSILRYRTTTVPIREMSYLFIFISIGIINSLNLGTISYTELVIINLAIAGMTYMLERHWFSRSEMGKYVIYERIENLRPENHGVLLQDLRERTGLSIHRVEVGRIDFLRDVVHMRVFYQESSRKNQEVV